MVSLAPSGRKCNGSVDVRYGSGHRYRGMGSFLHHGRGEQHRRLLHHTCQAYGMREPYDCRASCKQVDRRYRPSCVHLQTVHRVWGSLGRPCHTRHGPQAMERGNVSSRLCGASHGRYSQEMDGRAQERGCGAVARATCAQGRHYWGCWQKAAHHQGSQGGSTGDRDGGPKGDREGGPKGDREGGPARASREEEENSGKRTSGRARPRSTCQASRTSQGSSEETCFQSRGAHRGREPRIRLGTTWRRWCGGRGLRLCAYRAPQHRGYGESREEGEEKERPWRKRAGASPVQGYKRRYFEDMERTTCQTGAGSKPGATGGGTQEEEKEARRRRPEGLTESFAWEGRTWEKGEGRQEEEKEEEEEAPDSGEWSDSELKRLFRVYISRGCGERGGGEFFHGSRGPHETQVTGKAGEHPSSPGGTCEVPDGAGCDLGLARGPEEDHQWSQDHLLFPSAHQGGLRQPPERAEGDVHVGVGHRPTPTRRHRAGRRRVVGPLHGHPSIPDRSGMASRKAYGALPFGRCLSGELQHGLGDETPLPPHRSSAGKGQQQQLAGLAERPRPWQRRVELWRGAAAQGQERKRKSEGQRQRSSMAKRRQGRQRLEQEPRQTRGAQVKPSLGGPLAMAVAGPSMDLGHIRVADIFASCDSLATSGCVLAWWLSNAENAALHFGNAKLFEGAFSVDVQRRVRRARQALPISLGDFSTLVGLLQVNSLETIRAKSLSQKNCREAWTLVACYACNAMFGRARPFSPGRWTKSERRMVEAVRQSVDRLISHGAATTVPPSLAEKDLKGKRVNYLGEEVGTCHVLTLEQVLPALPPPEHGGSIELSRFVCDSSLHFLRHPQWSIVDDVGQELPKLQGKIHIQPGDVDGIANELVNRGVCRWIPLDSVMKFRGERVLNGLFGVEKSGTLENGKAPLRLIMNLVPSNSVMKSYQGAVKNLPQITSWMSIVVEDNQEIRVWQSDMSNAFYLFALPAVWSPLLAFNIIRTGEQLNLDGGKYALACAVLPMGWSNSVSLMQEASENILLKGHLNPQSQVVRGVPLPPWVTGLVVEAKKKDKSFWHVYLDNFAAGEVDERGSDFASGDRLHQLAEAAWTDAHVVSSSKKRKSSEIQAQELGAHIDGFQNTIGGSPERLLKLVQCTLFLLSQPHLSKRITQVLAGRWVHVFQFRRPAMAYLEETWKFVTSKGINVHLVKAVRRELFACMTALPFLHTYLGSTIATEITASDASNKGGAVGVAKELTDEGKEFVAAGIDPVRPRKIPVLVLSLFNGIGGALRCYDILGVVPEAIICFDTHGPAQRTTGKHWPQAELHGDVRTITEDMILSWFRKYVPLREVHLWAGFPCTDLSAVKAGRQGLEGPASSLFWEVVRIKKLLVSCSPAHIVVKYTAENVASMDKRHCEQITNELGVTPYYLNCSDAIPMQRPRLCWTSEELEGILDDIVFEVEAWWTKIVAAAEYPALEQWVSDDSWWPGGEAGHILPTAMKSIKRKRPPPSPAGYRRCDWDTIQRWTADSFRFPPYHYQERFLFWVEDRWRLCSPDEKEILLGYGCGHTKVCFSASRIKENPEKYLDERHSLLGDSFSVFSFVIPAVGMCRNFIPKLTYAHLVQRMGLAPGFTTHISKVAPLGKQLQYGQRATSKDHTVQDLNRLLLTKVNHTGSDIRMTTGEVLSPKAVPRQSIQAAWWDWLPVFRTRWRHSEHINLLELRSVMLAAKYQILRHKLAHVRIFHVTDSFVSMSVVAKGRTASRQLGRILKELNAWLLGYGVTMVLGHVESTENPTDGASRQIEVLCEAYAS